MESYKLAEDITAIGVEVTSFPNGIKEAFGSLMKTLGSNRDYYGISWCDENAKVKYYAMAREIFPGEGNPHRYKSLTISKGDYHSEALHDWINKTDCIKDVFHRLTAGNTPDKEHPCIEWYQSDEEMLCMVKAN